MYFVWTGVALLALKLLEINPVAELGWGWVLSPLVLAFIWFEFLERLFGKDRQEVEHVEYEELRKKRVAAQFADPKKRKGARAKQGA